MDATDADARDLRESMGLFQAALKARGPKLIDPPLEQILLALDGSNQDPSVEALALQIARRNGATLHVVEAYEGPPDSRRDGHRAARARALQEAGVSVGDVERSPEETRRPSEQILGAAREASCQLIVVCAPYQEDFRELGNTSAGTNLDLLMANATIPLLVGREPREDTETCFARILLPITPDHIELVEAASWALRLVSERGAVRALAIIDQSSIEAASEVLRDFDEIDDATLAGLRRPETAGLIGALQRQSAERGIGCRVSVRSGDAVPETIAVAGDEPTIIVVATSSDTASASYQRAHALVRASRFPVLVV